MWRMNSQIAHIGITLSDDELLHTLRKRSEQRGQG
jgi:hypothetical protein